MNACSCNEFPLPILIGPVKGVIMEVWDSFNPQQICWRRSISACKFKKPELRRYSLAHRFTWPLQQKRQLQNGIDVLWLGTSGSYIHFPLMALKKGSENTSNRRQKLCKVKWNLEAEIEDGQQLYVSGSLISLGAWDPELAIPMSASEGRTNLWQAEIQVPRGTSLEYNYFVKGGEIGSDDITWRPGPTLCLSVPLLARFLKKGVVVQDRWLEIAHRKIPILSQGTWGGDMRPPGQSRGFEGFESSGLYDLVVENSDINIEETSYQFTNTISGSGSANICDASSGFISLATDTQSSLEEGEINSNLSPQRVLRRKDPNTSKEHRNLEGLKKGDQPIEEPWLPATSVLVKEESVLENFRLVTGLDEVAEVAKTKEALQAKLSSDNEAQPTELQTAQEAIGMVLQKEKDVTTEIIINSSVCTIQRIAILEDGKPVEILLDPVKTNVQVGSIYLGTIKKLLPHMSGAFVDIGISRLALLTISKNKEPFAFPPLDALKKENQFDDALTKNLVAESSLNDKEEDYNELLKSMVNEDEISLKYEDDEDEDREIEEALEEKYNPGRGLNTHVIDVNTVSSVNMEDRHYFNRNGHDMREENDGEHYSNGGYVISKKNKSNDQIQNMDVPSAHPLSVNFKRKLKKWMHVREGTKIIVQVIKEELGTKGPLLSAFPSLTSRFWVLLTQNSVVGVSRNVLGPERTRLKLIAKTLQPPKVGLTVRTVAAGHSFEELQKDLTRLLETWKEIVEHAKSAFLAAQEGVEGAVPVILHRAMGQTLAIVQDDFNEKVQRMVVDSPRTYHEVTRYLQEYAPSLGNRVELYTGENPIFDEFGVENEIDNFLSKRVYLPNGGYLVIEQTEALVSIDVNGGSGMLGEEMSKEQAILEVNLAAARQIARELRLRDIGGIIVVDFIDMDDEKHKRMVYEEVKKSVERDRSSITTSELSAHGLMEITRKRVRPSVTYMISEPCSCCHASGRVEALDTTFSKIERAIRRFLARRVQKANVTDGKSWPRIFLRVDPIMSDHLTSGKKSRIALLSSSLKVWIVLKATREYERGQFEVSDFAKKNTRDKKVQAGIVGTNRKKIGSRTLGKKLRILPFKVKPHIND